MKYILLYVKIIKIGNDGDSGRSQSDPNLNRFGFCLFRCANLVCARRLFEGGERNVYIPVGCKALNQLVQSS
jgi:hypothetical protein